MPLVKIGRQLADELRGLVDVVERAEARKPSGLSSSSYVSNDLAVPPGKSTPPHNHLIFLVA